jgi:hypothetical protein
MRAALLALALLPSPALADGFRDREIVWQTLNAVDAVQTCHIVRSGRGIEGNPLVSAVIGKRPSCGAIAGYKVVGGVIHYAIAKFIHDRDPETARVSQIISIVMQGGVVGANMRLVF